MNQPAASHPTEDVIVAERDPANAAADKGGADIPNDGFDFGKLGHEGWSGSDRDRSFRGGGDAPRCLTPADIAPKDLPFDRTASAAASRLSRCAL